MGEQNLHRFKAESAGGGIEAGKFLRGGIFIPVVLCFAFLASCDALSSRLYCRLVGRQLTPTAPPLHTAAAR
jgi:hypothetical protein